MCILWKALISDCLLDARLQFLHVQCLQYISQHTAPKNNRFNPLKYSKYYKQEQYLVDIWSY